jgi:hypothetical protein
MKSVLNASSLGKALAICTLLLIFTLNSTEAQGGGNTDRVISTGRVNVRVNPGVLVGDFVLGSSAVADANVMPGEFFGWDITAVNPFQEDLERVAELRVFTSPGTPESASEYLDLRIHIQPDKIRDESIRSGKKFIVKKGGTSLHMSLVVRPGSGQSCFESVEIAFSGLHYDKWIDISSVELLRNFCIAESITSTIYPQTDVASVGQKTSIPVLIHNRAPVAQKACVEISYRESGYDENFHVEFSSTSESLENFSDKACIKAPGGGQNTVVFIQIMPLTNEVVVIPLEIETTVSLNYEYRPWQ